MFNRLLYPLSIAPVLLQACRNVICSTNRKENFEADGGLMAGCLQKVIDLNRLLMIFFIAAKHLLNAENVVRMDRKCHVECS